MNTTSGGETKSDPSGWSTDTLKTYIERMMEEHDRRYEQRFIAQKEALENALASATRAVDKAEEISEKWRQNANEWRAAMGDKDKQFLTKDVAKGYFISGLMAAAVLVSLIELFVKIFLR